MGKVFGFQSPVVQRWWPRPCFPSNCRARHIIGRLADGPGWTDGKERDSSILSCLIMRNKLCFLQICRFSGLHLHLVRQSLHVGWWLSVCYFLQHWWISTRAALPTNRYRQFLTPYWTQPEPICFTKLAKKSNLFSWSFRELNNIWQALIYYT